jgi:hypothetical protein
MVIKEAWNLSSPSSVRRLQGGKCSFKEDRKLATLSTVNSKLIPQFLAKDLLYNVCTNNINST